MSRAVKGLRLLLASPPTPFQVKMLAYHSYIDADRSPNKRSSQTVGRVLLGPLNPMRGDVGVPRWMPAFTMGYITGWDTESWELAALGQPISSSLFICKEMLSYPLRLLTANRTLRDIPGRESLGPVFSAYGRCVGCGKPAEGCLYSKMSCHASGLWTPKRFHGWGRQHVFHQGLQ